MTLGYFAKHFSVVAGVALTCDVEWINPTRSIIANGAKFVNASSLANEVLKNGSDGTNKGLMLKSQNFLDDALEVTQALIKEFQTDKSRYAGNLSILYSEILGDPAVPGSIKNLIAYKQLEIPKKISILTEGIFSANEVIKMHSRLSKQVQDTVKEYLEEEE